MLDLAIKDLIVSDTQRKLDLEMVPFDIWGTQAHVCMLHHAGIISNENAQLILGALAELKSSCDKRTFEIDKELGAQLTLEKEVVRLAGDSAGLSMHTARSRNDQVMVTELLYLREHVLEFSSALCKLMQNLIEKAEEFQGIPFPGYTHMQPGKPTTATHWVLAYVGGVSRINQALFDLLGRYDKSPLGAVESFGTSWPIDRDYTSELLGFGEVWSVTQDAISHRGFLQAELLGVFSILGLEFTKMASDLLMYSTYEFDLVSFGENVAQRLHPMTGSSVMAQKKNPDALEVLRSIGQQFCGLQQAGLSILGGLPSGYNRDSRELKEYIALAFKKAYQGVGALQSVIGTLKVNQARAHALVINNFSLTTDLADSLAQKTGLPYRKVYKILGIAVDQLMQNGRSLSELSMNDLQGLPESALKGLNGWKAVLEPVIALERRGHVGGTSSARTKELLQQGFDLVAQQEGVIAKFYQRIDQARFKTAQAIAAITQRISRNQHSAQ